MKNDLIPEVNNITLDNGQPFDTKLFSHKPLKVWFIVNICNEIDYCKHRVDQICLIGCFIEPFKTNKIAIGACLHLFVFLYEQPFNCIQLDIYIGYAGV